MPWCRPVSDQRVAHLLRNRAQRRNKRTFIDRLVGEILEHNARPKASDTGFFEIVDGVEEDELRGGQAAEVKSVLPCREFVCEGGALFALNLGSALLFP